jgi:hypothetical protein
MLYLLISQLGHLAVWGIAFLGGVIFLRRGWTSGAMSVLFGSGILVVMQVLYLVLMTLQQARALEGLTASRMYQVMWVPQLVGGFLFALGFLQLARATQRDA